MQDRVAGSPVTTPSKGIADFVERLEWGDLPVPVVDRAKILILDALGVGIASRAYPFAQASLAGAKALASPGPCSVIGETATSSPRDAALANGILVHGLDFDDTHLKSIIHASAACIPAALAMAEVYDVSGRDFLLAYAAGMEVAIRVGAAADGRFHHTGYHATAIASHFSSAMIAAKILGCTAEQMVSAQGIAASTAGGVQVFLEDGAWTKRLHPGWGAVSGITAATLAKHGFVGPKRPYEGKFGLFETHFQEHLEGVDYGLLTAGLGTHWMLAESAIKPYPICHFIHGCAEAAIDIGKEIDVADIVSVEALLPGPTMPIVAEPHAAKIDPLTDYEAKFSAQFVVATCLARGCFGLAELEHKVLRDPGLLALAAKVQCRPDPQSGFPTYFSGAVSVALKDGRKIEKRIPINLGAGERALDVEQASEKFRANAALAMPAEKAERVRSVVLGLDIHSAADLGAALRG